MNLRDLFSRKVRDGREREYRFDSLPDNSGESPDATEASKISEADRAATAKELDDWSKVYFDHPMISDLIRRSVLDWTVIKEEELFDGFKKVIDMYLPREYKVSYCVELIRFASARMFALYGQYNSFYVMKEVEFRYDDEFRKEFLVALYKICDYCSVSFLEAFSAVRMLPLLETDDIIEPVSYYITWSFSDFTYILTKGCFRVIGGKEDCVDELKKIFDKYFEDFFIDANEEDIAEINEFDIRYASDGETSYIDAFMDAIDSKDYFDAEGVMEIGAIEAISRIYPQNISEIYTYYFKSILHKSEMVGGSDFCQKEFVGILDKIKDQVLYRSEEFSELKEDWPYYLLDVIDIYDGATLNATVEFLTTTFGIEEEMLNEYIAAYIESHFESDRITYGLNDVQDGVLWIAKLLSNKVVFDVVRYYKPSIIDTFS